MCGGPRVLVRRGMCGLLFTEDADAVANPNYDDKGVYQGFKAYPPTEETLLHNVLC